MKIRTVGAVALSLALSSLVSWSARAQENAPPPPPPATTPGAPPAPGAFGSQGQLVLSTDIPLARTQPSLFFIHTSASMGGPSATTYGIMPSLDYFVSPNLSVGGALGIAHGDTSFGDFNTGTVTTIEVAARVGYDLAFTDAVSLWPRLGLGYEHWSVSGGGDASGYTITLDLFAPFLWHPAQHFFVGGGPVVATDLISKQSGQNAPKETAVGLQAVLGGYFGL